MNIDLNKRENLRINSSRREIEKGLIFFSTISNDNLTNIFYVLTRSTSLKDVDIKFIIAFLQQANYVAITNDRIVRSLEIESSVVIDELTLFYFAILANNREFNEALFINSEFTILGDEILINIFSVPIKYRAFFTSLRNLGLLDNTDKEELVKIKSYTLAKKFLERPLRKISPSELEKELEKNRVNGLIAEKFVFEFERTRLGNSKKVDWVAQYVVNYGYDIMSFDNESDGEYNRFIEVKSYEGDKPYFLWSRNEYTVAERRQDKYWLYLVNRKEMSDSNYKPKMIQNPYKEILQNPDTNIMIESYKVVL